MEQSGDNLYFAEDPFDISMLPKAGGSVKSLGSVTFVSAIAIHGSEIYATSSGLSDGGIYRLPLAGGTAEKLVEQSSAGDIVVDDQWIYWTKEAVNFQSGGVFKMQKTGSEVYYYGPANAGDPLKLRVANNRAYWSDLQDRVLTADNNDSQAYQLAEAVDDIGDIEVDATHVYYTVPGAIMRVSINGGAAEKVANAGQSIGIHLDDVSVIFTDADTGQVQRIGK
jgi:hypothetical protein